jgi:hypothetical protein
MEENFKFRVRLPSVPRDQQVRKTSSIPTEKIDPVNIEKEGYKRHSVSFHTTGMTGIYHHAHSLVEVERLQNFCPGLL